MANAGKVKRLAKDIKTHWKKPAPGKYVPYREYLDILIVTMQATKHLNT